VELLRALLPLLREDPDISLLMVGDGPDRWKVQKILRREYSRKSIEISKNFDIDSSVKNLEVLYSQLITQHKNL
jgi:glycosyltransferase involved in cell wall biosynthesis